MRTFMAVLAYVAATGVMSVGLVIALRSHRAVPALAGALAAAGIEYVQANFSAIVRWAGWMAPRSGEDWAFYGVALLFAWLLVRALSQATGLCDTRAAAGRGRDAGSIR